MDAVSPYVVTVENSVRWGTILKHIMPNVKYSQKTRENHLITSFVYDVTKF
jgi:hypothetical protein